MTAKIDISPEQLAIVQGILKDHLPKGTQAWSFGSRVTWTAKPFSDLDIALEGAAPLAPDVLIDLEEAFEASDLPWKVDVIDLNAVSPEFRAIVERQRVPVPMTVLRLGDYSQKIGSGATPRGGKDSYLAQGPYSLIRSQNVHNHGFEFGGLAYIDEDQARKLQNVEVLEGDVLVNITGDSVARVCMVHPWALPARVNQHVAIVRPDPSVIDPFFLRYWLVQRSSQAHLLGLAAAGATRNALTKSMLEGLEIPYVEIDVQRQIGAALRLLDDKIELNRRMNETLEALARAVFRDWFVDFGPTRRKAAGKTDPAAILGGLLPDPTQAAPLAALFPDSFGANGLPEGWQLERLDRYLELAYGKALTKKDRVEGDYPVYGSGGISGTHNAPLANGPAIIVGRKGTVGSLYWEDRDFFAIDTVFYVVPKTRLSFLFYMLETLGLEHMNTDAAVPGLNRNNVYRLERVFGCEATRNAFADFADQFRAMIRNNEQENQTLAATRDLLLPKLMSGDLRLTGAEGVV